MNAAELERFESHFVPEPNTGCWLWFGGGNGLGYGRMFIGRTPDRRTVKAYAHRLAYEHWRGPIPRGLVLDHLCRTPACVNPDHLEPVTQRENIARVTRETCRRGHRWDDGNAMSNGGKGKRTCLLCKRESRRRSYYKLRARK